MSWILLSRWEAVNVSGESVRDKVAFMKPATPH